MAGRPLARPFLRPRNSAGSGRVTCFFFVVASLRPLDKTLDWGSHPASTARAYPSPGAAHVPRLPAQRLRSVATQGSGPEMRLSSCVLGSGPPARAVDAVCAVPLLRGTSFSFPARIFACPAQEPAVHFRSRAGNTQCLGYPPTDQSLVAQPALVTLASLFACACPAPLRAACLWFCWCRPPWQSLPSMPPIRSTCQHLSPHRASGLPNFGRPAVGWAEEFVRRA